MDTQAESNAAAPSKLRTIRLPLWVTLVAVALLVAAVVWHLVSQRQADQRQELAVQAVTQKLNAEHAALQARAREAFSSHSEDAHRLFGTALSWAIRSALTRNDYGEIEQYFSELVKNQRIRLAVLSDPEGKLVLATDGNMKGSAFTQHFPAALLNERAVAVHPGEGQLKRLVMPIQGLSAPLGTALVVYEAPALQ